MSTLKCFLGWSNFATNQFLAYCPLVGNWDVLKILKVHLIHETYRKPVQQTLDLWFCFLKNHAKYVVTQLLFFGQRSWGLFLKDLRSNPSPLSICTWILQFSSLKYQVWVNLNFKGYSRRSGLRWLWSILTGLVDHMKDR